MSKILKSMERKGWRLSKRWFDFDDERKPIVRFVKYLEPLMPSELADRIVDDSAPFVSHFLEEGSSQVLKSHVSSFFSGSYELSRLAREAVHVYVNLSVTESELNELEKEVFKKGQEGKKVKMPTFPTFTFDVAGSKESKTIPVPTYEKELSSYDREKINKKLMKANLKEDLKNKLRQGVISLGGGLPGF